MSETRAAPCFGYMASLGFGAWPVEEVARCLAGLGYGAVEWTGAHFGPGRSLEELRDLVRIPERYGLAVSEAVVQQDFVTLDRATWEQRVAFTADCIRAAAQAGISTLNLFTGPAPWDPQAPRLGREIGEGQSWELVLEVFGRLVPLAEQQRVYLAVEAVFGHLCHDYYTLRELLDHFDSAYLAVNMDPSHYRLYDNDVPWVVQRLGPRIRHVHLKDVVGRPGMVGQDFCFPLLGEGVVDWPAFATALQQAGYRGALSVEFEAFGYYERVLARDAARAAALSMEQIKALFAVT
jgi:sugar phosphate isomerase/epimerase